MYHSELGKTTMEIYDETYVSNPEKNLYRSRLRQQVANVLQRRVEQLAALEAERTRRLWLGALHEVKHYILGELPYGEMISESLQQQLIAATAELLHLPIPEKGSADYVNLSIEINEIHRQELQYLDDISDPFSPLYDDEEAKQDMIEEAGPVNEKEQGGYDG